MRKITQIFLMVMMLVVPTFTHAVSCNMPQAGMNHMADLSVSADEPCPHHMKQQVSSPCEGMSVADCLGIDMVASTADTISLKVFKSDASFVAVLTERPGQQLGLLKTAPRAPPKIDNLFIPQQSLILTTQRFHI